MKLTSYYFSFEPTGNEDVDKILEAVCIAGSGSHSTDGWSDRESWRNNVSIADEIQAVANMAAKDINLQKER